jgi:hypothetical protein
MCTVLLNSCRVYELQQLVKVQPVKRQEYSFIKIDPVQQQNYTNKSLLDFQNNNKDYSVIVRDLANRTSTKLQDASLSQSTSTARICQILEQGLLKKNYKVRDRQLFEFVADKTDKNLTYTDLHAKTGVDVIFEVTALNWDRYEFNDYYQAGVKKYFDPIYQEKVYFMYGFSIEIKVILTNNDNIVGGTYKYSYTPCDATKGGCVLTSIGEDAITYIPLESSKFIVAKDDVEKTAGEKFLRDEEMIEKYEKTISEFIDEVVIPGIETDIKNSKNIQNSRKK